MVNYFADNLRYLRKQYNLTQDQMGKIVGKTYSAISHWEKGMREPSQKDIAAICQHFDITPDLLCYTDLELKMKQLMDWENYEEFNKLFQKLTPEQQDAIIATMKAMVG